MSKANALSLVSDLSRGMADQGMVSYYYDHLIQELGQLPIFTRSTILPVTADDGTFDLPDSAITLLEAVYDDRVLASAKLRELAYLDSHWRDRRGSPVASVTEGESDRTFRLYPVPEIPSKAFSFAFGEPMGRDFPEYAVTVIHTEDREFPEWLDLPVALEILAREFARESDHRDLAFAHACRQLADLTMLMILED